MNGFNLEELRIIDDGDYQGTQIFIIPLDTYQPSVSDYVYTHTYYGSCSGCDTLQAILGYDDNKKANANQVEDLMQLSLHLLQKCKMLEGE